MYSLIFVMIALAVFGLSAGLGNADFVYPGPFGGEQNVCTNPEGKPGVCVDIQQCEHLAAMLKATENQQNKAYVEKSRCKGNTSFSVCCGPKQADHKNNVKRHRCDKIMASGPPAPSTGCCGVDTTRIGKKISGGTSTAVVDHPWLALIEYHNATNISLMCGGSLISARYVLTAAHCVRGGYLKKYGQPKYVRLGEYNTANEGPDCAEGASGVDCTDGMMRIAIEKKNWFPWYMDLPRSTEDIALLRLKDLAPYTDFIRPICLPSSDLTKSPPPNFSMTVAGWGKTLHNSTQSPIKLQVQVPYVDMKKCHAMLSSKLWDKQICAGGEGGRDSCLGDSGGPLIYKANKNFEVIGVVSYGPKHCGEFGIPAVYTYVFAYKNWILKNITP